MSTASTKKEAFSNFFQAYGRVSKEVDRRMLEAGVVSLEVYDVLLSLEDAPEQRMRMSELADHIIYSRSGLTRLADRLEQQGLIQRVACPNDRRALHVTLTSAGLRERERAWPVLEAAMTELFSDLITDAEAATVRDVFARVLAKLGK